MKQVRAVKAGFRSQNVSRASRIGTNRGRTIPKLASSRSINPNYRKNSGVEGVICSFIGSCDSISGTKRGNQLRNVRTSHGVEGSNNVHVQGKFRASLFCEFVAS